MKQKYYIMAIIIAILSICLFQSCDKDCPVCPEEPGEPGNYRLYVFDSYNQLIMSIDTPADTIVDSTRIDYYGAYIFVTPDSKRLLVMRFDHDNGHKMEVYNTSDLSHIETLEQYGFYYFNGGDNYGIWNNFKKVFFINPADLTPFDSIDFNLPSGEGLGLGYLDTTSNQYFVATSKLPDDKQIIYQVDCHSRSVKDSVIIPGSGIGPLAYNGFTNDLYFLANTMAGGLFYQYDLNGDSVISTTFISHSTGSIAVSPDGRQIYMTDGGHGMLGIEPLYPIWVFDAITHQPTHWIAPYDSSGWVDALFGQIILTPDNRRAYLAGNSSSGGGTPVAVIDLQQYRIIKAIRPYNVFDAASIALGPIPKN